MSSGWVITFAIIGAAVAAAAWALVALDAPGDMARSVWWVAAATGALTGALAMVSTASWRAVLLAPFDAVIVVCAVIDARSRIIPNRLTYPSLATYTIAIVAVGVAGGPVDLLSAGLGLMTFGGALFAVALAVPRGMGMGDVKLAALIGLVLGAIGLRAVVAATFGAFLGGVIAAVVTLAAGRGRHAIIPFGPFLAVGGVLGSFVAARLAM
jgi:leader peptidase (prepilin peptidase)/N-methyltransferase